ncbi:MAG: hypothetical protein JWO48_1260 [Bryobacterales bacterium]|jgi:uncharacterized membrane protein YtjA (UPF0391 family)|nr:hypothetical protein [Bryobacterales bacterium]
MLYYALVFFLLAILCAIFGFGFAAVTFALMAKVLFFLFLVAFVISLVAHLGRRRI